MGAPKGSQNALGNRGGRRRGYEFEREQLTRMRKAVDRALWTLEAIQKGRVSDKMIDRYQKIQPTLLKLIDKLHATKIEQDHTGEILLTPIPIYGGLAAKTIDVQVSGHESDEKNLPAHEENPSS